MHLSEINNPEQIKKLSYSELNTLCEDIRKTIIHVVSGNGGHLASNLGNVELTLAVHRSLNCPSDKIIFDVGHQSYTHKLITGRYKSFHTLRQTNGICGFPRREESQYDTFSSGHASNSVSAALGLARARDLKKENYKIAVILGDGALTGGMAYEGLNDAGRCKTQLLVILNDNGMSISRNVGAVNQYLTHMRVSKGWQNVKKAVGSFLKKLPFIGDRVYDGFHRIKNNIRNIFVHDKLFSSLGFRYLGPIDGHDIRGMEKVIKRAVQMDEPVLLHVYTQKGNGFLPAENMPDRFHGTPPFRVESGETLKDDSISFGKTACRELIQMNKKLGNLCVVTAAMSVGTCMEDFGKEYPDNFFDVGIAEEHAITMCSGMSLGGMFPFAAIYDSFLQRSFDQIIEDVCMQKTPVCILSDRCGIGSDDGASHHGMFGTSYLRIAPGLKILMPMNVTELKQMLHFVVNQSDPVVIRYPRAEAPELHSISASFHFGQWQVIRKGTDAAILSSSNMLAEAIKAADILSQKKISLRVINASTIKPLDEKLLLSIDIPYFIAEENVSSGSLSEAVCLFASGNHSRMPAGCITLPDTFIPHGSHQDLLHMVSLDGTSLADRIYRDLKMSEETDA